MLGGAGLKATRPRMVVFEQLISSDRHPTADQLYEAVRESIPGISRGTVYRILDHLVEAGLASQVASRQGLKRYDANLQDHHHIYCTQTHQIQDFVSEELHEVIQEYFENKKIENFKISEVKLQINGIKLDPTKKVTIV